MKFEFLSIENEAALAREEEKKLANAIDIEKSRATTAEEANALNITNEINRATTSETDLQNQINEIKSGLGSAAAEELEYFATSE